MTAEDCLRIAAGICRRVAVGQSNSPQEQPFSAPEVAALVAVGREHRCLPLLAPQLGPQAPPELARELEQVAATVWASHELTAATLAPVLERAHALGVRVVVYKGAAQAARFYREPWRRQMQDVDLLLEKEGLGALEELLTGAGYRRLIHPGRARSVELSHERTMVSDRIGVRMVDLHLCPAPPLRHPFDVTRMLASARPARIFGAPVQVLTDEDELVIGAVNQAYDHFRGSLLRAVDGALLIGGGGVDWQRLIDGAGEAEARAATWLTLQWIHALTAADVPATALTALRPGIPRQLWLRALLGFPERPAPRFPMPRRFEQAVLTFPLMDRPTTFLSYLARHLGRRAWDAWQARAARHRP